MRFYNQPHSFYCGVDLHARSMFVHILNHAGETVFAKDLAAGPEFFLDAVKPFREGLVVGCECMFAWYWLADKCEDESIPFTLGHALYMRAVHGGKSKNDRIDAAKIAGLLRGGMFPMAFVYPRDMRETNQNVSSAAVVAWNRQGAGSDHALRDSRHQAFPRGRQLPELLALGAL